MDGGQCFITAVIQSWTNSCKYTAKTANISKRRVSWDPVVDTVPVTMIQIQTASTSIQHPEPNQSPISYHPGSSEFDMQRSEEQTAPTQSQMDEGMGRVWSCRSGRTAQQQQSAGSSQEPLPQLGPRTPSPPRSRMTTPGEENPLITGRPKERPQMPQHLLNPTGFHNIGTPPNPGSYSGNMGRRPWLDEYMDASFPMPSGSTHPGADSQMPNPPQMPHPTFPILQRPSAEFLKPLTEAEQLRIRMIENAATRTLSDIEELHRLRRQDEEYKRERSGISGTSGFPTGPASSPITPTPFPISKGNEAGPSPFSCQCRRIEEVMASQKPTGKMRES